jgi:DNA-binding GntR family transcriptional regulator
MPSDTQSVDRPDVRPNGLTLSLEPINATVSLRDQAYAKLRQAIAEADIYRSREEIRLDEKELTEALGVSRTPIREAMTLLEQEGFLRTVPRRGVYILRKTKREIVEMIHMWAALESMAARLATQRASDEEIARLRHMFDSFRDSTPAEHIDEYSEANIAFHQEHLRARARDPEDDDLAERPRIALDRRPHEHHRSAGEARHGTGRTARQAAFARSGRVRRGELRLSRLKSSVKLK